MKKVKKYYTIKNNGKINIGYSTKRNRDIYKIYKKNYKEYLTYYTYNSLQSLSNTLSTIDLIKLGKKLEQFDTYADTHLKDDYNILYSVGKSTLLGFFADSPASLFINIDLSYLENPKERNLSGVGCITDDCFINRRISLNTDELYKASEVLISSLNTLVLTDIIDLISDKVSNNIHLNELSNIKYGSGIIISGNEDVYYKSDTFLKNRMGCICHSYVTGIINNCPIVFVKNMENSYFVEYSNGNTICSFKSKNLIKLNTLQLASIVTEYELSLDSNIKINRII